MTRHGSTASPAAAAPAAPAAGETQAGAKSGTGKALRAQALEGVRIVEFGGYAAGPHIGKLVANYGATVVHVESRARPDGFRLQYPPYRHGKPDVNGSGCFALFNDSKYAVTVDLKRAEGVALARRLIEWSDVVVENMRPGIIDRLGLGYASFAQSHPGLIMLSTCNMGQTGPRADTPGFGSQLTALAGMCNLIGDPAGTPNLLYGPYIDFIASTMGSVAVLAALEQRRRTGKGAYLDVAQYECGLMFLAGPLLDYHAEGRIAARAGNDDPDAAPHGAWRCADGEWLALSCWSDAEFGRLAAALGRPELGSDPRYASVGGRRANREGLDAAIGAWAQARSAVEAASQLQAAAVHAHPVNDMADLFTDPQLVARRQWRWRRHPVMGEHAYCFPPFDLAALPGDIVSPAPVLGGDNERVFRDLLGMSAEEYEAACACGAID